MKHRKFELSPEMIQVIGKALGAQPHDMVRGIIEELQRQINAQQAPIDNGLSPDGSRHDMVKRDLNEAKAA